MLSDKKQPQYQTNNDLIRNTKTNNTHLTLTTIQDTEEIQEMILRKIFKLMNNIVFQKTGESDKERNYLVCVMMLQTANWMISHLLRLTV